MKAPFSGGCSCGAIRYECTAEPVLMLKCHCRDCQQAGGGAYTAAVIVPSAAFRITRGAPRYYATPSERRGTNTRGFCPDCGSRLLGVADPASPIIGINAGSLDDPSGFAPQMDIFICDAQPWDLMDPALPKHETYFPQPQQPPATP